MREKFFKNEMVKTIPRNSMTSENWVTLIDPLSVEKYELKKRFR